MDVTSMVAMTLETEITKPQSKPLITPNRYWVLTIIISAITASTLSYFGYILYDPLTSLVIGAGIGFIYAVFADKYWAHVRSHVFHNKAIIAAYEKEKERGE